MFGFRVQEKQVTSESPYIHGRNVRNQWGIEVLTRNPSTSQRKAEDAMSLRSTWAMMTAVPITK